MSSFEKKQKTILFAKVSSANVDRHSLYGAFPPVHTHRAVKTVQQNRLCHCKRADQGSTDRALIVLLIKLNNNNN